MRKLLIMLFSFMMNTGLSQEHGKFSFWANIGAGISTFGHKSSDWSMCGNVGISIRYSEVVLKYKRNVHSEFDILGIQDHAKMHEIMLGYSTRMLSVFYFNICGGIGSLEEIIQGRYIGNSGLMNDNYEMITRSTISFPIELEIQLLAKYAGFSYVVFSEFSRFRPIYGIQINLLLGYL